MKKKISLIMVLVLLIGIVGVTLAWLTDKTAPVENTFTVGDINIKLEETDAVKGNDDVYRKNFKMLPGHTIGKDPIVTVIKDSEEAWLFVKIEKSANFDNFLTYSMAGGWTELGTGSGIFYRQVPASATDQPFDVIAGNVVQVKDTVTKADLNALTEATYPKLTFTAYAHQLKKDATTEFTANEAWTLLNP